MDKKLRDQFRYFLKDTVRKEVDFSQTAQSRGIPPPPLQKPCPVDGKRIALAAPGTWQGLSSPDLITAIGDRRSHRNFTKDTVSLDELSFMLWATQGITRKANEGTAFRTVPSAGCRHAFETYLCILNVAGTAQGIYRYLPVEHQLLLEKEPGNLAVRAAEAAHGQTFIARTAITFIWTTLPQRMEWRYDIAAHKVIALDAGHVCQNLYLAAAAAGCGVCAVAAYDQQKMDKLLGVDGEDEFTVYLAAVGKI
ncbi:MAG: thioester oxidase [Thermodesulfovibrio sp.]|nr:thioester oxidase [Thermodesulfovibrio sp.]